ncbi:hypothetical protein EV294_104474 [Paenibacillus sp. BK033]|nr:hypothetical protein EV294_104474 [Paenibacillus sp. BK033]
MARPALDVVIGEADHHPAVQDEMVLAHEVVSELSAVSIPQVWAVAVNLDANLVGLAQIGIVQKTLTILIIIDLVFRVQMFKLANSRQPNLLKK